MSLKPNILVIGGAGYIGSHICKYLSNHGYAPIVLDNLVCGHREAVKQQLFFKGSMEDRTILEHIFTKYEIAAVIHFAAHCYVGESVIEPAKYYKNNVVNTALLLEAMLQNKINKLIFSSSCATYGDPVEIPIAEDHPQKPVNPYGRSKHIVEQILEDFRGAYGLRYFSLRYFNAAGADPDGELGEDHRPETHLIPLILQIALGQRVAIEVFGDDYPTRDGTCIRDYIHVDDISQAHLLSLEKLLNDHPGEIYNLGNRKGYSVREVIDVARKITGKVIPIRISDRRPGDPAVLVGSSEKAIKELGWITRFSDLETIIETAYKWHKNNPHGYQSLK